MPVTRLSRFGVIALAVLMAGAMPAGAEEAQPAETGSLAGVWGAQRMFVPGEPIRVVVHLGKDRSEARALDVRTAVTVTDDAVAFTLPHGRGAFRGARQRDTDRLVGHWISEPGVVAFSSYATPMSLDRVAEDTWVGVADPIRQPFSIYLLISQDVSGKLRALLRNPERNQGVFTRLDTVRRDGSDVQFLDADGAIALSGTLSADEILSISMPWRGGTYDLVRRGRSDAPGFYPAPDTSPYRYAAPMPLADGWQVATAGSVGVDASMLAALVQRIRDTDTTSLRTPYIQSVLVARRGKLVLEEYFYGFHSDRPRDLRSASKSITGILVGQAIDEIEGLSLTTPVYSVLADHTAVADARRRQLTVAHLLGMQSGFFCDDNDEASPGNEDVMQAQQAQPDWVRYALDLPMIADPGDNAVYCSAGINLAGAVVSEATGTWLPEFFRSRLAEPLQIAHYHMNLDPLKRGYAGGGMQMRPRDFLKIAQLVLDEGSWNGRRIVAREWVREMLAPHASIYGPDDYGFTWWRSVLPWRGGRVPAYSATGNGGQLLIVVPDLELVVGFNGANYGDFRTWISWRDELTPETILKAIAD